MKKLFIINVLFLLVFLSLFGCERNRLDGHIVNQSGQGVEGVTINAKGILGNNLNYSGIVSNRGGEFNIEKIEDRGWFNISGRGGKNAPYIIDDNNRVFVDEETVVGEITAYKMWGMGVIKKANTFNILSQNRSSFPLASNDLFVWSDHVETKEVKEDSFHLASVNYDYYDPAYFLLTWEKITGYDYYKVYLTGKQEAIWENHVSSSQQITVEVSVTDEIIKDYWTGANIYTFKIIGENSNGQTTQLPEIDVSLKKEIKSVFPQDITYANGQISWNNVAGADSYRILIYDQTVDNLIYPQSTKISPDKLTTSTSYNVSNVTGIETGETYQIKVDAWAIDSYLAPGTSGWPVEISRAIEYITIY